MKVKNLKNCLFLAIFGLFITVVAIFFPRNGIRLDADIILDSDIYYPTQLEEKFNIPQRKDQKFIGIKNFSKHFLKENYLSTENTLCV